MNKPNIKQKIETIIEELQYALNTGDDVTRDIYIKNAIRFAQEAIDPIPLPTIKPVELLNQYQIAIIRTLWELAQGRIDALYSEKSAEEDKQATELWMIRVFPKHVWSELVRAGSEVIPNE
ncbi:hypothetical protein J2T13_000851 [Paenibacillus sp. DS2015]|uniref:hypothetical protein n=1 Tax=Paenibacillus sp. DS2015 TaxID=3373917 RepID=UPI003D2525BB